MIQGLEKFRDFFKGFEDHYTLIGGVACELNLDEAGIDFRVTKDLDLVLAAEVMTPEFVQRFWEFVKEGGYQVKQKSSGAKQFYRFSEPQNSEYPVMLELFSRAIDGVVLEADATLTPIPMDDDISSLSAILLDESYYRCLQDGRVLIDGVAVLSAEYIIPFKMRAYQDLRLRREQHGEGDAKHISKHKNDVFRMVQLLSPQQRVNLPEEIKEHMRGFIEAMQSESIDLKNLGLRGMTVDTVLDVFQQVYGLNEDKQ
ncbi:hypothetical protein [Undibacterium sp. WLHG33]|uniref:hypothetical protein n=1 Tax=Undibacterium sp. WLHG33 TaxID=3412482 RepID=UPI003C2EFD45